jgi:AraC-like DNA-binding protein
MAADTLSDVLRAVRLTGAVFFSVDARSPWAAEAPPGEQVVGSIMPGAEHLISYHVLTAGSCWGGLVGQSASNLEAGDIIVFPHGDAHVMSSQPGMRGSPQIDVYRRVADAQLPYHLTQGGDGPSAVHMVCGFLGCDARPFNPLLDTLPRVLVARARDGGPNGTLAHFARLALDETRGGRAGSECVLARLSELMFLEVVRHYLATLPDEQKGWLAGLRDPHVGHALAALHGRPGHDWSLDELAQTAGVSRSVLVERFTSFVGQPPMQYLAHWRMQLAAGRLVEGATVAAVAYDLGYGSEAAFSRAFKKLVGVAPAHWRRQRTSQ